MTTLRIATRGSKLALWQAHHTRDRLVAADASLAVELVVLKTTGDKILDRPLAEVGGKGLFVKEIEEALLDGRADVAVHSLKDLPAELAPGLVVGAISEREDPRDALLVRRGLDASDIMALPSGARVGTSSLRRACQLRARRRDLEILPLRGNVDTRLRKLDDGEYDAIVLAAAGLKRLGFGDRIRHFVDAETVVPAIGQGALALEVRDGDEPVRARVASVMAHEPTWRAARAERAFLGRLEGGCRTPIAAHAIVDGEALRMTGLVGRPDGTDILRDAIAGNSRDAEALGLELANRLLARGADKILRESSTAAPVGGP